MRYSVISAGTNSCRLLIVRSDGAQLEPEFHDIAGTRLGEGLIADGALSAAAMQRTLAAMTAFAKLANQTDRVFVIGTGALREASNAREFARAVQQSTGHELRILSGEEESRASFDGAMWALAQAGLQPPSVCVADVGGGSTELAVRAALDAPLRLASMPIGAVVLTERFFKADPPQASELAACRTAARLALEGLSDEVRPQGTVVAVGGSADTAARMLHAYDSTPGAYIANVRVDDLADLLRLTSSLTTAARKRLHGLPESRADIFPAGLVVLNEIARRANARELLVSECDLLLGYVQAAASMG